VFALQNSQHPTSCTNMIAETTLNFKALTSVVPLTVIRTAADYDQAIVALNQLLDAGASNESHPLADLVDTLGSLIGEYEDGRYPAPDMPPAAMLGFLIDQHGLTQSDLPEVGTQGVVSEILAGKRELNVRQIRALAGRFNLPVAVFI
jgi:HTH-type transcriptional regulator / antitoxin HigA